MVDKQMMEAAMKSMIRALEWVEVGGLQTGVE